MAPAPLATWRRVPGRNDQKVRPIGVILHADAGNAYCLYDWWLNPESNGIESYFHVAKDGYVEQYRDTEQKADANYKVNSWILDHDIPELGLKAGDRVGFISVETGFFDGEWMPAQLARIRQILTWASSEAGHDFPLVVCPSPYEPAVGYHVMREGWGVARRLDPRRWEGMPRT